MLQISIFSAADSQDNPSGGRGRGVGGIRKLTARVHTRSVQRVR